MARLALVAAVLVGLLALAAVPSRPRAAAVPALSPLTTITTPSGIRIHALATGWVRIKAAHFEARGPTALRIPAILGGRRWVGWMPVWSYLVEHPERTVLVDTGVSPALAQPGYAACDPNNAFFYGRNLRFAAAPDETLAGRLAQLGVAPEAIDDVLITHFHADHSGGLATVPAARVWAGPGNWPSHIGALTCTLPAGFEPTEIPWDGPAVAGADASHALSTDGALAFVPLPGHTPGHAGLLVQDGDRRWLVAGDATFDLDQTARTAIAGVSEHVGHARQTQRHLQAAVEGGAVLLPAHDPTVPERLSGS